MAPFLRFLLYPPVFIGLLLVFLYYAFSIYRRLNTQERKAAVEKDERMTKAEKKTAELSQLLAWREEELERAKHEIEELRRELEKLKGEK